jgi:hypothetical protein
MAAEPRGNSNLFERQLIGLVDDVTASALAYLQTATEPSSALLSSFLG